MISMNSLDNKTNKINTQDFMVEVIKQWRKLFVYHEDGQFDAVTCGVLSVKY